MAKKSFLTGLILIAVLGLAGLFLMFPEQARADIAISGELGSQSNEEVVIITTGSNTAISSEISDQTEDIDLPGEGNFTTTTDGGGGGGGGGGGSRRRPTVETPTTFCTFPYLQKYIRFGQANDSTEVAKLQRFLRDFEGFDNLMVTGIYDEPTLTAVMVFQRRYAEDILHPWGLTVEQPTGYVFITTSLVINRLYCGYSTKHNLDLRNVYDNQPSSVIVRKPAAPKSVVMTAPVVAVATTTCPTTSVALANGDQTAAVGFLNFIKDNLWFWLIPLLVLILIFASYYLWREQTPEEFKYYDDDDYLPPLEDSDEVRIKEEEELP